MISSPERVEPAGYDSVYPELIAKITERVKREVVEHLNRTGSVEDLPKAPPLQRQPSNKSNSTSSPPLSARRVYTPSSATQAQSQTPKPTNIVPPVEPVRSPPSPLEKRSRVRFSDRTPTTRPPPGQTSSTVELSTIDQKWGRLFGSDGYPTQRLGQFLRGLANHIINEFQPQKSIVVTPTKMATYYSSYRLDEEPYRLVSIFRTQSNEQISLLYQDLGCEHHLVQDQTSNTPTIPGLTPVGFAQWMTIHILAYPNEESKRFEKVVLAMPIDADGEMVDGKPERLPKQISRHLLPERRDRKFKRLLDGAMKNFFDALELSSRRKASITGPPLSRHSFTSQSRSRPVEIHQIRTSPTNSKAKPLERERNSYTGAPSASESLSNEDLVKLERDRAPYTALPGNGKVCTEGSNLNIPKLGRTSSTCRTREPEAVETLEARHHRTKSNASQNSYMPPPRPGGKSYSNSTLPDISTGGSKYSRGPSSTASSLSTPSQLSSFLPRRSRDDRQYRRGTGEEARFTGEFNSPKDTEEAQAGESERTGRPRETSRHSRGTGYETYARNY